MRAAEVGRSVVPVHTDQVCKYSTVSLPDGQGQVSSPLVLGDHGAETGSEFVSPPWLALGQKFPVDLGPSGDHSVVSSPLHNPVSSGLSEVICVSGSLEGPEGLPGPPEVSHHDEIVEIVDELDLDPVATEKLVIAPFHKNQHRDLQSETPGETYSCRSVSLNPTGNLMVPISINGVLVDAVIDTAAQVTVLSADFVQAHLPSLQFSGVYDLNGIKNGAPVTATLSEDLIIGIGDQSFRWRALKADITDHCILGLDFIAKFQLDIKLSENTLTVGDCVVPVHLSNGHKARAHTVNTVALSRRVKIKPHSGVNFSLRLNSKFRSDADLAVFEPVCHPQVDILSIISVPDQDLPITILNNTGQTVTFRRGFVLGVLADVAECDVSSPDFQRPQFEVRTLYAHQFRDCFPAVRSDNFGKIQGTLPSHLQDLFRRSCTHITLYQAVMLANLLTEYASVFSRHDTDLGHLKGIYHRIVTIDDTPVKHHMRRTPFHFEKEEEENLNKMKRAGVVVDSCSEYASPVCLVRKKDGSVRWTIDLRSLNKRTVKDCFPLPKIEQCLDTLQGNQYFSTLDCASGYWQIEIHPEDQKKTAFITKYGLFEHRMMVFGLCNAAATFQRAMQFVLSGLLWKKCLCYIDDVHVLGTDFESALNNLSEIFERFEIHNLKMRPKKCILLQPEVVYLGRLVGRDGVTIRQEHVQVIKDWPVPKTKQELQSFLGFTNYHREYIKDYAIVTESLYKVAASSKSGPINLTRSHIDAIELLRECICNAPVFPYPSTEHTFLLDCDASDTAIGCELLQLVDGKEHIIAFGSFALTPTQRRYCTTRKELLAVLRFTREFRHYLLGRPFVVRTDHNSLTWLMSFKNIEGQLARWMEELSQFDMSVLHRLGKYHINADALSRIPDPLGYCPNYRAGTMLSRLPCYSQLNPCKFCTRAEATWTHFEEDVDYVVPLTVRKIEVKDSNEPTADIVQFGFPQYMQEELLQAQADDVDLGVIIKWLESEDLPSQLDLSLSSPAVRHYWLMRDQIVFCHNVMFYRWEDYSTTRHLLIVPYVLREEVLRMNHDVRDAGHTGQVNTFNRVRHAFYWFRMRSDIYTYVKTCAKCNTNKKPRRRRRAELGQYHAGAPMDRVMMDILGPLSKTPRGNTVILMLIDQFTKWIECYPLPDQSAEVVADLAVFEPVCHPQVDILSIISVPDQDLPITILNNTGQTVTFRRGFVLGVLADVAECDVSSPDFQRPQFEVRTLYAHQFRDCFPAVRSDNFGKIQGTLPSHLQDLFRRSCTHITLYQAVMLANLLTEYASVFSRHDTDLGHLKGIYHRIVTIDDTPVKHHMRRTPFHFEKEEEENLNKMKRAGVVVDSCSEYASPVCLVRKKDGSVRWTIDLRSLNKRTVKDCFPLPKIEQCLDTLQGNQYFSTLDCASGYWQIEIHPEDQKKTAFITKYGLFEHRMMAFGLCNAAATFQRAMQFVLSGLLWKKCLCYIDDVHVLGTDFESALNNLRFLNVLKFIISKCVLKNVFYFNRKWCILDV